MRAEIEAPFHARIERPRKVNSFIAANEADGGVVTTRDHFCGHKSNRSTGVHNYIPGQVSLRVPSTPSTGQYCYRRVTSTQSQLYWRLQSTTSRWHNRWRAWRVACVRPSGCVAPSQATHQSARPSAHVRVRRHLPQCQQCRSPLRTQRLRSPSTSPLTQAAQASLTARRFR